MKSLHRTIAASLALAGVLAPAGCTALLGGGGYSEGTADGSVTTNDDSAVDGGQTCVSAVDKASFEGNRCSGQTCSPGDNSAVFGTGHCAMEAGAIVCTVPAYAPPDAGPIVAFGAPAAPPAGDAASDAPSDAPDLDADADAGVDAGVDSGTDAGPTGPVLPSCSSIAGSNPIAGNPGFTYPAGPAIFAIGSTAIQPYVGSIAQQYAAGITKPGATFSATIIYVGTGSCVGVEAAYAPPATAREPMVTAMKNGGVGKVLSGSKMVYVGTYYDPTPPAPGQFPTSYSCAIDPSDPNDSAAIADVGFSDVFPSSCTTLPYPAPTDPLPNAAIADLFGPVQVMELVVPTNSPAKSITYEQAQLVWGYGGAAGITPWTDSGLLFRRTAGSGTQTMIGAAIALDPRVWVGVANSSSGSVLSALKNTINTGLPDGGAGNPQSAVPKALGILSSDFTDDNSTLLRPLAFQDRGQACAWLPDSSPGSFDKRNVRDGHYPIWGPAHVIAPVQGGVPSNPVVNRLYAALNGQDPALASKLDVIRLYATHHIVPTCAMHVTRSSDGKDYGPYVPAGRTACSCYYDSVVPQDKPDATCTPCARDADCGDPSRVCNVFSGSTGFCEVKGGL